MKGLELYQLIKELSPSRKRNLTLFGNLYQKKASWKVLFDRFNEANEYKEEEIRGKEFKTPKAWSTAKRKIVDILVASIAQFEYNNQVSSVEIARDLDLQDYTIKELKRQMAEAQKEEDLERLHKLYQLSYELQADPAYRRNIPKVDFSEELLIQEINLRYRLNQRIREIKQGFQSAYSDRGALAQDIFTKVESEAAQTKRNQFLIDKARAGCVSLESNIQGAIRQYQNMVSQLEQGEIYRASSVEKIGVYASLILYLVTEQRFAEAQRYSMKMSMLAPSSNQERRVFDVFFITCTIGIAGDSYNLHMLELALDRLRKLESNLSMSMLLDIYQIAAKVYFIHGQPAAALRYLRKVEQYPASKWARASWLVRSLELAATYELNDWDRFEYVLERATRWAAGEKNSYPKLLIKTVKTAALTFSNDIPTYQLDKCMQLMDKMAQESPEVKNLNKIFDFRTWVRSKLLDTPMSILAQENIKPSEEVLARTV